MRQSHLWLVGSFFSVGIVFAGYYWLDSSRESESKLVNPRASSTSITAVTKQASETYTSSTNTSALDLALRQVQPQQQSKVTLPPVKVQVNEGGKLDKMRPRHIGQPVDLNAESIEQLSIEQLEWERIEGGEVAHLQLQSPDALYLRMMLEVKSAPEQAEFRFYSPTTYKVVAAYTGKEIKQKATAESDGFSFWSPVVDGDVIALEIFLPDDVSRDNLQLTLPRVSHIFDAFLSAKLDESQTKAAEACHIDVACASGAWQETARSVGRYIYTESTGLTYTCSGTLIADTDENSQIPYFLSANHCVDDDYSANTTQFWWFDRNQQCGVSGVANLQTTTGGATLLSHSPDTDYSLMQLNTTPPNGVVMSGWSLDGVSSNQSLVSIHHPNGDVKKYSQGSFQYYQDVTYSGYSYSGTQSADGNFITVVWNQGVTAGGSSGAGLWIEENNSHYLVGTLLGGASYCSAPNAPDDYGRFDRTWPHIKSWIAGEQYCSGSNSSNLNCGGGEADMNVMNSQEPVVALKEGILIARYISGLRGSALLQGMNVAPANTQNIEDNLEQLAGHLDIDGDGQADFDRDATILLRYMLGLRDESLIQELSQPLSLDSLRAEPEELEAYIETLLGEN